jgi:hypothetical protein
MPKDEHLAIELDDDEDGRLHAVWSRSGKHLIVTAGYNRMLWTAPLRKKAAYLPG